MIKAKIPPVQQTVVAFTFFLILGALSMIWPGIIALFVGVFLLFQSCGVEQEIAVSSWAEVGNMPIFFASLRRPGLSATLS